MVLIDMPKNPGRKGGKEPAPKAKHVPVVERRPRNYAKVVNINPFFLKKMINRIQVRQGCRGSPQVDGKIPPPPHDYFIARLERRHYIWR